MKKILNFMKKNIFLTIISLFILISLIIIAIVSFKFFINGNNKYGNRLDGIEEVEITSEEKKEIASTIEENDNVDNNFNKLKDKLYGLCVKMYKNTYSKYLPKRLFYIGECLLNEIFVPCNLYVCRSNKRWAFIYDKGEKR